MSDIREIKCEACPRVCPEDYQKMVERYSRACQERDRANEMLQKEQEKHRWIPVTERLPDPNDDGDYVIVCATEKKDRIDYQNAVIMAFVCDEGFVDTEMDFVLTGVTHWMPLPEPPKAALKGGEG